VVVARCFGQGGNRELSFMGMEFQFEKVEKYLKVDDDDGCTLRLW
jgi:hypothetical protein